MKKKIRKIAISKEYADKIQEMLDTENDSGIQERSSFTKTMTADFGNGIEADIKVCFEPGTTFIDSVLFNNGCEVGLCEPGYEILGSSVFEYDGVEYVVDVVLEDHEVEAGEVDLCSFEKVENLEVVTVSRKVMDELNELLSKSRVERCDCIAKVFRAVKFGGLVNFYVTVIVENHEPMVYYFLKGPKSQSVMGRKEKRSLDGAFTLEYDNELWTVTLIAE